MNDISVPEKNTDTWTALIQSCRVLVTEIRSSLAAALLGYHNLGKTILAANVRGEQLEGLSKELGPGFSVSNLYNCIRFAQMYPDLGTFTSKYGTPSWREVCRRLVTRSRAVSNALETLCLKIRTEKVDIKDPEIFFLHEDAKNNGYDGDLTEFISECVPAGYYHLTHRRLGVKYLREGFIDYLDKFQP